MMFLGQNDSFGELAIQEVFVFYDGPRLFVAENAAGQKYLFNCLSSEDDLADRWLVVPVSEKRLFALKDKLLPLRDAFYEPELGRVFELTTDKSGKLVSEHHSRPSEIEPRDLPENGAYLQDTFVDRQSVNAVLSAKSLSADIVLLHLYPGMARPEAPARLVGKILTSFQDVLSEQLARIPGLAQLKVPDVSFVGTFAGSFGIELAVRGEDGRIGQVLKDTVNVLGTAVEPKAFVERMNTVGPSESRAVTKFMKTLRAAKTDLKVETASQSDATPVSATVSLKTLRKSLRALTRQSSNTVDEEDAPDVLAVAGPELRTVVVEMVGLNLRTKTFELRTMEDSEVIRGTMEKDIFSDLEKAELPSRYRVVLERVGSAWKMISATKLTTGSLS
jgi:hypothetical protein